MDIFASLSVQIFITKSFLRRNAFLFSATETSSGTCRSRECNSTADEASTFEEDSYALKIRSFKRENKMAVIK